MFGLTKYTRPEKTGTSLAGFGEMQHEMERIHNEMERLFGSYFTPGKIGYSEITWYPAVDLSEKEDKFILKAELPGMNEKDIEISVEDNTISLRGEKKEEREIKERYQHRLEMTAGKFYRSFQLPTTVDAERIEAHYKNGVLEVMVPKSVQSKTRLIKID